MLGHMSFLFEKCSTLPNFKVEVYYDAKILTTQEFVVQINCEAPIEPLTHLPHLINHIAEGLAHLANTSLEKKPTDASH